ncbi:unnamed protein product, partial [Schistosoma turkestanicum]
MNSRQEFTEKHYIPLVPHSFLWFPDVSKPLKSYQPTVVHHHHHENNRNYHSHPHQTDDFNRNKPSTSHYSASSSSWITAGQKSLRSKYKLDRFNTHHNNSNSNNNNNNNNSLVELINHKHSVQTIRIRKHLYNNNHANKRFSYTNGNYAQDRLSIRGNNNNHNNNNNRGDTLSQMNTIHCESWHDRHNDDVDDDGDDDDDDVRIN